MRNAGNAAVLRRALERCRVIELQWQADEAARQQGTLDKPQDELARDAMTEIECVINSALESPPPAVLKTISEIVAEYRLDIAAMQRGLMNPPSPHYLCIVLDRIENAARRAYNEIDHALCGIDSASSSDIDFVRSTMDITIGDYEK